MNVIVGLGNPGEEYTKTRHNAGFMAVDALATERGLKWEANKKFHGDVASSGELLLFKPATFMNNSGQALRALFHFYKLIPKKYGLFAPRDADLSGRLTVIHDDLDLPIGTWRESTDSRSGGHRGVQSIIDHLKTKNFRRWRIGVANEHRGKIPAEKFVLARFAAEEQAAVDKVIGEILASRKV